MKHLTLIILSILCLSSCNRGGYIALQDAERGMFLERANTVSISTFFNRRMESELDSNYKKNWYIVNEDIDYVYFGMLVEKKGFTMVNPFFKVKRERLAEVFPGYKNIEGKHVKAKIFQNFVKPVIDSRLLTLCPQSYNVQFGKRQYLLTKEGILADVDLSGRCYEDRIFTAKIRVLLDATNIDVISSNIDYR